MDDGHPPTEVWDNGHGRVLAVYERRVPVPAPSSHQVPGVGPAEKEIKKGHRGGVRVGAPTHPLGQAFVGCEGDGGRFRVSAHDKGRVHRSGEFPRRTGGRPAMERRENQGLLRMYISFVFPSSFFPSGATSSLGTRRRFPFCLSLSVVGGPTMTG